MNSINHITQISYQIDSLAANGCRLLTREEREEFFKTTSSTLKPYYIKGCNKGKERQIYEVNGKSFNRLWQLISPYVFVACDKSTYSNSVDREDAISEIKYECFRTLQLYGPVHNNQPFSQRLKLVVNNVLTNEFHKKGRKVASQYIDDTVEVFDRSAISISEQDSYFLSEVPFSLKDAVEMILSGMSLIQVKKFIKKDNLETELLQFVKAFR